MLGPAVASPNIAPKGSFMKRFILSISSNELPKSNGRKEEKEGGANVSRSGSWSWAGAATGCSARGHPARPGCACACARARRTPSVSCATASVRTGRPGAAGTADDESIPRALAGQEGGEEGREEARTFSNSRKMSWNWRSYQRIKSSGRP